MNYLFKALFGRRQAFFKERLKHRPMCFQQFFEEVDNGIPNLHRLLFVNEVLGGLEQIEQHPHHQFFFLLNSRIGCGTVAC